MRANVAWGFCMKIALTGHRPDKLNNEWDGRGPCSNYLRHQLDIWAAKASTGISGMALGADMLWAECILSFDISLWAAIPCDNQTKMWPLASKNRYNEILSHPNVSKGVITPGPYAAWKMQKRNEWMVDKCDLLVAVWNGTPGGTANCVKYAKKVGRPIEYVNPDGWRQ